jgi:superoxide reductase
MNQKFLICKHCGNIVAAVKESGVPIVCCGEKMSEIIPGEVEASREKHIPEFKVEGNKVYVTVGSVEHPMAPEHYIEWVSIQTKQGNQRKQLQPGQEPKVCFSICDCDEVEAVYAYCNLHGLWVAK